MASSPTNSSTSTETESYYRIGWRNHRPTISTSFENYFETQTLTDVTLVCENGESINGHKIVLAASSSWFEQYLLENMNKHHSSMIFVPSLKFSRLMDILDYMYKGEVILPQEEIGGFLKAAKMLKLKGLVYGISGESEEERNSGEENRSGVKVKVSMTNAASITPPLPGMRTYKKYTEEDVIGAIQAVRDGTSPLSAARQFAIPARTLYEKLKKLRVQTPRSARYSQVADIEKDAAEAGKTEKGNENGETEARLVRETEVEAEEGKESKPEEQMKKQLTIPVSPIVSTEASAQVADDAEDYDSDVMVIDC
ncbi:unnamed protein product [Orchesella dallaii]|uniref:BTB domain-containing protein n=1 Tax=Orchesella dallaii TaxID=48710 RepID=A0ABP1QFY1_9HEXA